MELHFSYNKKKVIQALRLHFTAQKEIKILIIIVNVFAIVSAVLFYMHKIQPQPFLIGSLIWILLLLVVWYILPLSIYKKSATFKDAFTAYINQNSLRIDNEKGYVTWEWQQFTKYFESAFFFHIYFNEKSFFLIPKDDITDDVLHEIRAILNEKISKK
ncbi:MAG: YcxB family protein [Bacteroidetes bacterium]|nr:YcxB family protein [Bacteroidota bacterium]